MLYIEHISIARKAYQDSYSKQQVERKPLDDNF